MSRTTCGWPPASRSASVVVYDPCATDNGSIVLLNACGLGGASLSWGGWWGRRSGDEQVVIVGCGFICFIVGIALFVAYNPPPPDLNNTTCYIVMMDKDGGEYTECVSIPVGSSCTDHIIRTTAEPEP